MELLFESRTNLSGMSGQLLFIQYRPAISRQSVIRPDCDTDAVEIAHFGSVLYDRDRYRMWYLAMGEEFRAWTAGGPATVAYAESPDGDTWTKPSLGIDGPTNLVDLGLHSATVFIDPESPPERRYRAVGTGRRAYFRSNPRVTDDGYYTASSPDGLRWQLDADTPRWPHVDVVTSIYHPGRRSGLVALKRIPTVHRIARRSIHTAVYRDGHYSDDVPALYPDEYDDICAIQHGFQSCDYYGMAMLPAARATVGFVWRYWHQLPYSEGEVSNGPYALYGRSDISLAYQSEPGARWLHMPGRPDFISRDDIPGTGWIYSNASPVEVGDEHRLYMTARAKPHGYGRTLDWQQTAVSHTPDFEGAGIIHAAWPKWRLFGFEAVPEGKLCIDLGELSSRCKVRLNYETLCPGGHIRATLHSQEHSASPREDDLLTGDALAAELTWDGETIIEPSAAARLELTLSHARVYAYDIVPA